MAELLYRLGRASARQAWLVVTIWILVLAAAGGGYALWGGTLSSAVTIPGTATGDVTAKLQAALPVASGATGSVVFHTTDGSPFTDRQKTAISALLVAVDQVDGVGSTVDPFDIADQRATQEQQVIAGQDQLSQGRDQLAQQQAQLDAARAQAVTAGAPAEMLAQLDANQAALDAATAEIEAKSIPLDQAVSLMENAAAITTVSADGSAAVATVVFSAPQLEVTDADKADVRAVLDSTPVDGVQTEISSEITGSMPAVGIGEVAGLVAAALVLTIMLGSILSAALPLVSALLGVGIAALGSLALSGTMEMLSATPMLGVMIGLAVGIDYSLFILNRHRRQLREGLEMRESIGLANGTSGTAVVFAGVTVVIALVALNVTGIPFLGVMGNVAALGVAIAVLIAVTLTPALLGLVGMRALPRRHRGLQNPPAPLTDRPMSTRRAVLNVVGSVVALLVIAIPALGMRLSLPDATSEPEDSPQYRAMAIIDEQFGAGQNGPLVVVGDLPAGLSDGDVTALQVRVADALMAVDDVVAVAPIGTSDDNRLTAFQLVPASGPTSEATEQLVHDLRALTLPDDPDVTLGVAGAASGNIDVSEKLSDALPLFLVVVVGLSMLILVVVFRSLLVPVVATGAFILSVFAALGGVTAIFQWGWLGALFGVHTPGPILNFLPTMLVGVLFGLAMDYQIFLVSGMREAYAHGADARSAVTRGLHAGRSVVTAAAAIMIAVFGGFVFSEIAVIRPMGFGLAFGVLLDAFVGRMLLVPALMHLAGEKAWWLPTWLDRILPNVDVEGASLERRHHERVPAQPEADAS